MSMLCVCSPEPADRQKPVASMQGYLTSLFGNVLLLGCFVDKQEGGATAVQAIGALANYAMLTQVQQHRVYYPEMLQSLCRSLPHASSPNFCFAVLQIWLANLMPSVAYLPLTALMASAGLVNGCKFVGALNSSSGQGLWRNWQDFLGLLGIAMLPQVACNSAYMLCTYLDLLLAL